MTRSRVLLALFVLGAVALALVVSAPTSFTPAPVDPAADLSDLPPLAAAEAPATADARAEDLKPVPLCAAAGDVAPDPHVYGALTLTVQRTSANICTFTVTAADTTLGTLGQGADAAVTAQFIDLDADRQSELVVVADSRGTSGLAESFVFAQRPMPRLIGSIKGCAGEVTQLAELGTRAIKSCDTSYNLFEGLCPTCGPRPLLFFALESGTLRSRGVLFSREFDTRITEQTNTLKEPDLAAFVASKTTADPAYVGSPVRGVVLSIAADYIYSGRSAEARAVLDRMWPAFDRDRVFMEILGRLNALTAPPLPAGPAGDAAAPVLPEAAPGPGSAPGTTPASPGR